MLTLTLPWPPSVNRLWRSYQGRQILAAAARRYRRDSRHLVSDAMRESALVTLTVPLEIAIDLHPPTRQRYDADNRIKAILDLLQHAGLVADDAQFQRITVTKCDIVRGGRIVVSVTAW